MECSFKLDLPFYACEMLEILKGIAYTSTECRKRKGERNVY